MRIVSALPCAFAAAGVGRCAGPVTDCYLDPVTTIPVCYGHYPVLGFPLPAARWLRLGHRSLRLALLALLGAGAVTLCGFVVWHVARVLILLAS